MVDSDDFRLFMKVLRSRRSRVERGKFFKEKFPLAEKEEKEDATDSLAASQPRNREHSWASLKNLVYSVVCRIIDDLTGEKTWL